MDGWSKCIYSSSFYKHTKIMNERISHALLWTGVGILSVTWMWDRRRAARQSAELHQRMGVYEKENKTLMKGRNGK